MALKQLALQEKINIVPCGLFIDRHHYFMSATPDGLVGDEMTVEIKCPVVASKMDIDEAVKQNKIKFWRHTSDGIIINKKDNWYF